MQKEVLIKNVERKSSEYVEVLRSKNNQYSFTKIVFQSSLTFYKLLSGPT